MTKKAILFGSIGAVAETSDIQRRAYNQAMAEHGLDWSWDRDTYSQLLESSGGRERLSLLANATGAELSQDTIHAIHARKTEIACEEVRNSKTVGLRPGVAALVRYAKDNGLKLGFVTTTYRPNVDAILDMARPELSEEDLDVIVVRDDVKDGKPSPEAYELALNMLSLSPKEALAIEDTQMSLLSAKQAGIDVIATPGVLTSGQDTSLANLTLAQLGDGDRLDSRVLDWIRTEEFSLA